MPTRYFRTAAGWLADTFASEEFSAPIESHEADLAAYYGASVTGVESDADPRTLPYVVEPTPDAPPPPEPTPFEQLITALAAEPALSQQTKATLTAITGGAEIALPVPMTPAKP